MTINLGIDLGTTNSAIAYAREGRVQVFSNPNDMGRRTLPSVVAFRKARTIIGTKARQRMEKDPLNVFGVFKRKMGTSERFTIPATGEEESPISLSSYVLRELLSFLPADLPREAAVITIPASFDTVQSKATEAAGLAAGFRQVSLLQEPIAASLTFANQAEGAVPESGKWLVYDLGGGTFDVALLSIADGEMKVIDHVGDNFLGGTDFDRLIVEKIMVPKLEEAYDFTNLIDELKSARGKYNAQFYILRQRAEEAKIALSSREEVEILIDGFEDEDDEEVDLEFLLTRADFNRIIHPYIEGTMDLIADLLTRNGLTPEALEFVLLVGGSTFIPLVRERLTARFDRPLNADVDPTTCVAEGAAAYAATRPLQLPPTEGEATAVGIPNTDSASPIKSGLANASPATAPKIKLAYPRSSREEEETLVGKASGDTEGWQYRIVRQDGGFDSGLRPLKARLFEDLPLVADTFNTFTLTLTGPDGRSHQHAETIGINGGYAISGQPLPEDITLEVDDPERPGGSRCLVVFNKNAVLPLRRTLTRSLNRPLRKGYEEDQIRINVLEGPADASPEANKKIGFLSITGRQLSRDVSSGTDVEISLQMNENRDLTVMAYLTMTGQEFEETFTPTERHTPLDLLRLEYNNLARRWEDERAQAESNEEYELLAVMQELQQEFEDIGRRVAALGEDDTTDERYQLEDRRRAIVRRMDGAMVNRVFAEAQRKHTEVKARTVALVEASGTEADRAHLTELRRREAEIISAGITGKLEGLTRELEELYGRVFTNSPAKLRDTFAQLLTIRGLFTDNRLAETYILAGQAAISQENWPGLLTAIQQLYGLVPAHMFSNNRQAGDGRNMPDLGKIGF